MDYIKLSRKILEWEWYSDINTCRLFIHLLLKANWKEGRFQGVEIPRGSLVTSYSSLAKDTGLSVKNVRTALKHLEATGEVAVKRQAKFSVVEVKNYDAYQTGGTVNGSQTAVKRQANGSQVATIEESKKGRRKENNNTSFAPDDESPCAGKFLLNDSTEYAVSENDVVIYQQLYPGIDVRQELRNIEAWCLSNPKQRKTRNGAKRFLNAWLSRSQNSARPEKKSAKRTGFNDFPQRDYDFAKLEADLIEN